MTHLYFVLVSDCYFCPLNPASDITETTWLKASPTQDTTDTTLRWLLFTWTGVQTSLLQCPTFMLFDLIVAQVYYVIMLWYRVLLVRSLYRILGFRRAPLVVGRYVNLRTEIKPVATDQLLSTFLMQGQYLSTLGFAHTSRINFLVRSVCVFSDISE